MSDFRFWFFIIIILTNMDEKKMKEIEDRIDFKLWLKRVGFKSIQEYRDMVEEKLISREQTILYYLKLKDEKEEEKNVLDDIVKWLQ